MYLNLILKEFFIFNEFKYHEFIVINRIYRRIIYTTIFFHTNARQQYVMLLQIYVYLCQ